MIGPRSAERDVRSAILIAGDFLVSWACLALAVYIRRNIDFDFTRSLLPPEKFLLDPTNVIVFTFSLLVGLALSGFYTQRISRRHRPVVAAALLLQIALAAVASVVLQRPLPRTILFLVPLLEAAAIPVWRRLFTRALPVRPRRTALYGDSDDLTAFINAAVSEDDRIRIVGLVGPSPPRHESVPYWGTLDKEDVCTKLKEAEQVIFVSHDHDSSIRLRLLAIRRAAGFLLLPSEADSLLTSTSFGWVGDQPLVEVAARCGFGAGAFVKRAVDLTLGAILTILAVPLSAAIAIAIWFEDRQPVLIRQQRAGRDAVPFGMWKFRTMHVGNGGDDNFRLAGDHDERVTRIGQWLRRHRLDELPQLINVLRGEMSLVGPRPERPEIIEQVKREVEHFDLRLLVRPGIAGLAQVWAEYDTTPAVKLRYDLTYMCAWSLWLDFRILLRAIATAMSGRGV